MDFLVAFIPLVPLLATLLLALGQFSHLLDGSRSEALTSRIACWSVYISTALCFWLLWQDSNNALSGSYIAGTWLSSGTFVVSLRFQTAGPGLILSCMFSLLFLVIFRFSRNYLHS
jgi:NADH:ubiquinone oxidoreductase subunit 5 (subunit L)/multisubunit Na+/H+ antiporter MnhA subunit